VLTLAVVALHAQRPAGAVDHDHSVQAVGLAGAAEIFERFPGTVATYSHSTQYIDPLERRGPGTRISCDWFR
jgi:hypothetical protein